MPFFLQVVQKGSFIFFHVKENEAKENVVSRWTLRGAGQRGTQRQNLKDPFHVLIRRATLAAPVKKMEMHTYKGCS